MGLPFTQSVPLQELGGEEVREVRISPLWPGGDPAVTDVGARYDFTAQAELDAVDELQGSNRARRRRLQDRQRGRARVPAARRAPALAGARWLGGLTAIR
jgi:hypothetical protein